MKTGRRRDTPTAGTASSKSAMRLSNATTGHLLEFLQGPVPVRLMLYGVLGSLPMLTAMRALSAEPPPVGLNVTAIVHDEFAAAVGPQVLPVTAKSVGLAPLKLSLTDRGNPDLLVIVTFLVFGDVFAVSVPYASVTGAIVAGIVGPVVIRTVYGLSGSGLSETESAADSVPSTLGEKDTIIEHAFSAPSVVVQVPPLTEKSAGLMPLKLSLRLTCWV